MITATIPAISSTANKAAGPATQNVGNAGNANSAGNTNSPSNTNNANASFSEVLHNQQTPQQAELAERVRGPADKTDKATSKAKDDTLKPSDDALALLASGLVQPQLTLNLAAHAPAPLPAGAAARAVAADRPGAARSADIDATSLATDGSKPASDSPSPQAITQAIQEQLGAAQTPAKPSDGKPGSLDDRAGNPGANRPKDQIASSQQTDASAGAAGLPVPVGGAAQLVNNPSPNALPSIKSISHASHDTALSATPSAPDSGLSGMSGALGASPAPPAASSLATLQVNTPLQHPQWADDFSQQFVTLTSHQSQSQSQSQSQTAELRLNPPDLGPLHISINLSDNTAHAVFVSPHAAVRSAVENALPQLQQALAQSGIALGQANVSDQRQPAEKFQEAGAQKRRVSTGAIAGVGSTNTGIIARASARASTPNALIDTFI
ncbi:flagellar hook-length control protein FliK [Paralcaligenes ureilyticus]|uniref:Flagellar hook-length control protein FliK n=1 Tax=Paralcaligenes ureilyticus TaxID=627131 RepID=A0A4R3M1G7_9BURK|nr:flagellar hook-length control protein FliK [Paralcaligenes ureilyticus]TCT06954.1 flagellar hook-length control protein FliK [Paralcaligenes ureilyticus]